MYLDLVHRIRFVFDWFGYQLTQEMCPETKWKKVTDHFFLFLMGHIFLKFSDIFFKKVEYVIPCFRWGLRGGGLYVRRSRTPQKTKDPPRPVPALDADKKNFLKLFAWL